MGAHLACASSDGGVSVLSFNDAPGQGAQGAWTTAVIPAHSISANGVSWAPSLLPGALEAAGTGPEGIRRLVSGGSDTAVNVFTFNVATAQWELTVGLKGHMDWVRDVSWSPGLLSKTYVASGSQDKTVRIWTFSAGEGRSMGDEGSWKCNVLNFECQIWRVSWSLSGNVLAVSGADNRVSLWKERVRDGGWECVKTMDE